MRFATNALLWMAAGLAAVLPAIVHAQTPLPNGSEFQVHTNIFDDEAYPAIAMHSSGAFVIAWHTDFTQTERANALNGAVYAQLFLPDGTPFGQEFQVNQQTGSLYRSGVTEQVAAATTPPGQFVIVWPDQNLQATLFAPDGTAILSEFQVNTTAGNQVQSPAVAMDGSGNFVIAWMNFAGESGADIFARRFDNQGNPLGNDFIINQNPAFAQAYPALAMLPAGEFVAVWQSFGQDGDLDGIFARLFNADGSPKANEFQVNTSSLGGQHHPDVGMNANGGFVITWASVASDESRIDIFVRAYDKTAKPLGAQIPVNELPGFFDIPAITVHPEGSFVVTYFGFDPNADGDDDIFARRFGMLPLPAPIGDAFLVNSTRSQAQQLPDLAIAENRDFVIAWQSFFQDGYDNGIYAQRYQMSPLANAGPDTNICSGDSMAIGGAPAAFEGAPPYSYQWAPSSGLDNPALANPKASPVTTTTYTLTVTDANGNTGIDDMVLTVHPAPEADAGADSTICSGEILILGGNPTASAGTPPYSYSWKPTANLDEATAANPEFSQTVSDSSFFTFVVTVVDANGCTATDTIVVTVLPLPTADAGPDNTICAGDTLQIGGHPTGSDGKPPYTYLWSPAANLSSANAANPNAFPTMSTAYVVNVTDACGQSAADTVIVTVNPTPTADAGTDRTLASGDTTTLGGNPTASAGAAPYTYIWSPATGLDNATAANPKLSLTASTITKVAYAVSVTDASACTANDTVEITVSPEFVVEAGKDTTICAGMTAPLGGSPTAAGGIPPYTYTWFPAAGLDDAAAANPQASPDTTTTYILKVSDSNNKTATDTVTVTVLPKLVVNAGTDRTICAGDTIILGGSPSVVGGTPDFTYDWSPSAGIENASSANPRLSLNPTVSTTTAFILTVADKHGCTDSDTVKITAYPGPIADAGENKTLLPNQLVAIGGNPTATGGAQPYTYQWSPAAGLNNPALPNPAASVAKTTTFVVTVVDANGCTDSDSMVIDIATGIADASDEAIPERFFLAQNYPNPFNPTTVIDYQLPVNSRIKLTIYDLRGLHVKTLVNSEKPAGRHSVMWDATDDYSRRVASGVYIYVMKAGDFVSRRKLVLVQ